ncbi:hypothetical protein A5739_19330 [Mycobacterium colombiense]|nr:hypothetical protein A5739_19330 [Mycobacterium colombiense]OMC29113.1 hypothetical protein A5738_21115 [Mycobacterium colombiense]
MQVVRVDTVGLQQIATRWTASAGDLQSSTAPTVSGLSGQASAAAVNFAHADVTAFTAALVSRVQARAARVITGDGHYASNETGSANEMSALAHPTMVV